MTITNNKGINYSKYVVEAIGNYYADEDRIRARVETFYNCREQGYVLEVRSNEDFNKAVCIWVCAQRNSDEPMVVWEETYIPTSVANMFSEESYRERNKCFNNVDEASMYCINNIIKKYFELKEGK